MIHTGARALGADHAEAKSGYWKHGLIITLLLGFTALIAGGFFIYRSAAPIPERVVDDQGRLITGHAQIMGGQAVYQKYDLMDYGSVLGHGSYFGPDFTAETLHLLTANMRDFEANRGYGRPYADLAPAEQAAVGELVQADLKTNRYDAATGALALSPSESYAVAKIRAYYHDWFTAGQPDRALPPMLISDSHMPAQNRAFVAEGDQINQIADFFIWTAWLSTANRPGLNYSYTNNWPFDAAAGNVVTLGALTWSAISVGLLVLFTALLLFVYHRWKLSMVDAPRNNQVVQLASMSPTVSQRKTAKYFAIVTVLFLVQSLLGALLAHYYVDGKFYGLDIASLLPFQVARSWHLQLAIFWIATAWLALGIFVAPIVSGKEPRWQGRLVDVLFGALIVVVGGSMAGEWLGVKGFLGNLWFALGNQGWAYLELGRVWQVLLVVGLAMWLYIVYRALRPALRKEQDSGGLTHLLLYSAVAIPFFYGFGFFFDPSTHITMSDYWRWWVIHLWVEGIFEVFAVVVIGFLMVRMGLVTQRSTLRALYFQLITLLGSGIIGTGHHYYWIGTPEMWIALGAVFSALEVIPLTLLVIEAHGQYRLAQEGGRHFPYRATFWFLAATAFWNLFGAGVLGFLINLPFVNYFEHGSFLTANHGHAALAGVYGMLGIALMLFALRGLVNPAWWSDRLLKISFWGLNAGLLGMVLITLMPVGVLQMGESFTQGFWAARSLAFYRTPLVNTLLWLRIVPDSTFIFVGVVPLMIFTLRAMGHLRRPVDQPAELAKQQRPISTERTPVAIDQ
jgi:nitric oxide reductase subunit B